MGASERFLGCHVSSAGGLEKALDSGAQLAVNTVQIHPSAPQRWTYKPFGAGFEANFLEKLPESGVKKVFFHGAYLINLASPDPALQDKSVSSLAHYLDLMERISGEGIIFHVGSNKDQSDPKVGLAQAAQLIDRALERVPGKSRLLLEVSAGAGAVVGAKVEDLAEVYQQIKQQDRVGFALDTQHLWASGYDLVNQLESFVELVTKQYTLEKIWAIHLNDSKTECASRKDRHENLGQGLIGSAALGAFINHPAFRAIPIILETPGLKEMDSAAIEVQALKDLAN